jgi:hypothetical protein
MNKEIKYSAIPMSRFGIQTLVLTQHQQLIDIREAFLNDPDWSWCDGKGKQFMHQMLKKDLMAEDAYFETNIDEAIESNQRWVDFMNDCVIFAVLDEVITSNPLLLLHPSCIDNVSYPKMPALNIKPSLIDDIGVLN